MIKGMNDVSNDEMYCSNVLITVGLVHWQEMVGINVEACH